MKKKALKIVIPLSLAAVLLIGLLLFFLIPPKQSNFRFALNAHYLDENGYLIDDANTYSYEDSRREENNSLTCPVGSTIQFRMMMGNRTKGGIKPFIEAHSLSMWKFPKEKPFYTLRIFRKNTLALCRTLWDEKRFGL